MRRKRFPGEFTGRSQMNGRSQVNQAHQGSSSFWQKGANDYGRPNSSQSSSIDPWGDWTNYPLVAWPQSASGGNQPYGNQGQYMGVYIPQQANYTAGYFVNHYEQQEATPMMSASFMPHAWQGTPSTMVDNERTMQELTVDSQDALPQPGENPSVDSAEKSKSGEGLGQPVHGSEIDGEYGFNLEDDSQRARAQTEGVAESEGLSQRIKDDERMYSAGFGEYEDKFDVYQEAVVEHVKEDEIKKISGSDVLEKGEEYPTVDRAVSIQTMRKEEAEPEEAGRQDCLSTEEKSSILVWKNFPK